MIRAKLGTACPVYLKASGSTLFILDVMSFLRQTAQAISQVWKQNFYISSFQNHPNFWGLTDVENLRKQGFQKTSAFFSKKRQKASDQLRIKMCSTTLSSFELATAYRQLIGLIAGFWITGFNYAWPKHTASLRNAMTRARSFY